jgi:hypothetical protein
MQKKDNVYKHRNTLNYQHHEDSGEINLFPSLTIPDQALSLNEIIRRFASGIPMDIGKIPVFDEENDLPDFRKMDLAERQEWKERFQQELDDFRASHTTPTPAPAEG